MNSRQKEELKDYIRRIRNGKGLSTADVEKNSGFTVTDGYVSHIENGRVKNVSPEKLRALAKGLQVSEEEIFAVARGATKVGDLPLDEVRVLEFYRSLPGERKEDALAHLELEAKRHGTTREPESVEMEPEEFDALRKELDKQTRKPSARPRPAQRQSGAKR